MYNVSSAGGAKDAVPAFVKRFKDPDVQVRLEAIHLIHQFGPASESAIPALKEALKDEKELVRDWARHAISAIEAAAIEMRLGRRRRRSRRMPMGKNKHVYFRSRDRQE